MLNSAQVDGPLSVLLSIAVLEDVLGGEADHVHAVGEEQSDDDGGFSLNDLDFLSAEVLGVGETRRHVV